MMGHVNDAAVIPFWMAFLVGPTLLAFAVWVLPSRIRESNRRLPAGKLSSASLNDAVDAWFPSVWVGGVGAFGAIFVLFGLLRLVGIE